MWAAIAGWHGRLVGRLRRRMSRSGAEVTLQRSGPRLGMTLLWRHSDKSRSKLALRLGMGRSLSSLLGGALSLTLSSERTISTASSSSCGVALQLSSRGVQLKLRAALDFLCSAARVSLFR